MAITEIIPYLYYGGADAALDWMPVDKPYGPRTFTIVDPSELPDQVDTEQHAGLLSNLGINPADLLGKLPVDSGTSSEDSGSRLTNR